MKLKVTEQGQQVAQIMKNGVAVGTSRTPLTNGSYTAYTEDITVNSGDRIQLGLTGTGGGSSTAKNFRIRFDRNSTTDGLVVIN